MERIEGGASELLRVEVAETSFQFQPATVERQDETDSGHGADFMLGSVSFDGAMMLRRVQAQQSQVDRDVAASAGRVREAERTQGPEAAALVVADETARLNSQYGTTGGARLMETLIKEDAREFALTLRFADQLSTGQRQTVAQALGRGFERITDANLKKSFAQELAYGTVHDAFMPGNHSDTRIAQLVAQSGSADFKRSVVTEMMSVARTIKPGMFGDNGGLDLKALFNGAAAIAESSPQNQRVQLFAEITKGLTADNIKTLAKDPELKDRLSRLFINDASAIFHSQAPDGAYSDGAFMDGMVKFFELTLFSKQGGALRTQVMETVVSTLSGAGDAVRDNPPLERAAYERAHGGWSQQDHVEAMGGLAAFVWKAAQNQREAIKNDQKAREETTKLLVGVAFAFLPGAKDTIGQLAAEGAGWLQKLPDKIIEQAWKQGQNMLEDGAEDIINNSLKAMTDEAATKNIDTLFARMRNTVLAINAGMPNGEEPELNLRSIFQSAFAFYNLI